MKYGFQVGKQYSRKDVFAELKIADPGGGNWYTGYNAHGDDWFIFCGVGTTGRTGHDYHNHFEGDDLVWFGKTGSKRGQPAIESLIDPKGNVYVFYREDNTHPFTFAGIGQAKRTEDGSSPIQIVWTFTTEAHAHPEILPQEIPNPDKVIEGAKKTVTVNIYERDPSARQKCIAKWGLACVVCGFDFAKVYGSIGEGFIHVHHLKPLAEIGNQYQLDPINDLRPVCPNCHAMLHRSSPALPLDELRNLLK